jgi:ferritin-like metal-binding protein YciE
MALFSGNIENLKTLYMTELRRLLSTEEQITDALPRMIDVATDPRLKEALESHLQETEMQAQRLEELLTQLAGDASAKKCSVTAALLSTGESLVKDTKDNMTRDAGMIAAMQKIEHFEMASYGTVRDWARVLGYAEQAELLNETLQEETHVGQELTNIAVRANAEATAAA